MNPKNNINHDFDSIPPNLAGGNNKEWIKEKKRSESIDDYLYQNGITMEEYLNVILEKVNRIDFPIVLDPKIASFTDVAIHGLLRQRLKKSTVINRIRYARFMESHKVPVDFRNPNIDNLIRHLDYREQIENAGYGALGREWDTYKTFLKAYGIPLSDFPYKPPSRPQYIAKTVPFPDQVNRFLHIEYSNDEYENALIQYLLTHNFVIGWRIPSEPSILKTSDVRIDDQDRGYIIVTEPKKGDSTRLINPSEIMTNKRRKSFKNWLDAWRPKVENQYSKDYVYLDLDGRPFNKNTLRMFLNRKAAPLIKTVFPEYHNYIARDFAAIGRLIRTKIQSNRYDVYDIKEWLGHTKIQTTMLYVKDAKKYYEMAPYDWINRVLKAFNIGGVNAGKNQKGEKIRAFNPFFSEKTIRTRRHSNKPTGEKKVKRTPKKRLLISASKIDSILIKPFFYFFSFFDNCFKTYFWRCKVAYILVLL